MKFFPHWLRQALETSIYFTLKYICQMLNHGDLSFGRNCSMAGFVGLDGSPIYCTFGPDTAAGSVDQRLDRGPSPLDFCPRHLGARGLRR
jgi:hypothetical protein